MTIICDSSVTISVKKHFLLEYVVPMVAGAVEGLRLDVFQSQNSYCPVSKMRISSSNTTVASIEGIQVLDPCDIKAENGVLCDVVQFDVGAARNYTFFAYGQAEGGTEIFSDQIQIQVVDLAASKVHDPYLYAFKAAVEAPAFHSEDITMTIPDNYTSDFMTYQSLRRFEYNASRYSLTILEPNG